MHSNKLFCGDTLINIANTINRNKHKIIFFNDSNQAMTNVISDAIECYKEHLIENPHDTKTREKLAITYNRLQEIQYSMFYSNPISCVNAMSSCVNGLEYCNEDINEDKLCNGFIISLNKIKKYLFIINADDCIFELCNKAIIAVHGEYQKKSLLKEVIKFCDTIWTEYYKNGLTEKGDNVIQKKLAILNANKVDYPTQRQRYKF